MAGILAFAVRGACAVALTAVISGACAQPAAAPTSAATAASRAPLRFSTVEAATQPQGSVTIELVNYAFKPAELTVKAGKVVFYLVNTANEPHALSLRDEAGPILAVSAQSEAVAPGHAAVFTIEDLPAGRIACASHSPTPTATRIFRWSES